MKQKFTLLSLLLIAVVLCQPIQAQLIFNEAFDYSAGNLEGSNGGTGFTSAWSNANTGNTGANSLAQIVAGQIGANGTGSKLQVTLPVNATNVVRYDRSFPVALNNDASTQEYWLGFWMRIPAANLSTTPTNTYGVAAQVILVNGANSTVVTDMRLGFGKTSNFTTGANTANALTLFSRAAPNGCGALNFPSGWNTSTAAQQALIGLSTLTDNVVYILANVKKLEFPNYQQPSMVMPNPNPIANFDGFRYWIMSAPPSGPGDQIFIDYPNGHISQIEPVTGNPLPYQNRLLRQDNTVNTTCVKDGVTGLRIRVEGNPATTPFLVEFDEIRFGTSLASLALPITLKEINAYQKDNTNLLQWTTSSESNNKGFFVERSSNGSAWAEIGFVAGAGNSSTDQKYSFIDVNPLRKSFYRIRQADFDGRTSFTKVVKVDRSVDVSFTVLPNPATNNITISLDKATNNNTVTILNTIGKVVLQTRFNGNTKNIDISTLSKGLYYIKLHTTNGITTEKILK
jgi:hypothetical protein